MTDDTDEDIQNINKSVKDLTDTLQKAREEISKSFEETNAWSDATKRVGIAARAVESSKRNIVDIGKRINENSVESLRLGTKEREFLTVKKEELSKQLAGMARALEYAEASVNAEAIGTTKKVQAQIILNSLVENNTRLVAEEKRLQKYITSGINDKVKALNDAKIMLEGQIGIENDLIEKNKKREAFAKQMVSLNDSLVKPLIGDHKELNKLIEIGNVLRKGGMEAFFGIVKVSLDRWIELDRTAEAFRKTTGLIVPQMLNIEKAVRQINTEFAYMGITLEKAYLAAGALYGAFQTSHLVTKDMISFTAKVAENLGISVDSVAEFDSKFSEIIKSTGLTTTNVIAMSAALASAGGVAPKQVMNDMAKASGAILLSLSKNPMALMRAAVEARRMGTTLENMGKSARGLLNYQESMTSELEASALLNQNISFQRARQLAWEGKIEKSREEALRQISKAGDFTKLNVYQQEALAKAAEMTVDEVIKQQNQQKLLNNLRRTNPALAKEYDDMLKKTKLTGKAAADAANKEYEAMVEKQLMQAELTKLTNSLTAAWVSVQDALLPIANAIMPPILFVVRAIGIGFKLIGAVIRGILSPLDSIAKKLRMGEDGSKKMENVLEKISKWTDSIAGGFEFVGKVIGYAMFPMISILGLINAWRLGITEIGRPVRYLAATFFNMSRAARDFGRGLSGVSSIFKPFISIGSTALKFLGTMTKFLGPIGLIISAVTFVIDLFGQWMDIWSDDSMSFGDKIIKSLIATAAAIYNTLIKPIAEGFDWLLKKIGINFSAVDFFSEWGKSMMDFLMGIGQMVIGPLNDLWDSVKGIFSGEEIGKNILKGLLSVSKLIVATLFWPFTAAIGAISYWLGNSPSELGLSIVNGIKSVGSMLLDVITWPFRTAWNFISKIFGGDGDLGNCIIDGVKSAMGFVFDLITFPYRQAWNFISGIFEKFGPTILNEIKSVSSQILEFIVSPFTTAWEKIKGMFGTMSPKLVDGIIKGISSVGGALVDSITAPFRAAFDFIKNIFSNIGDLLKKIPFINKIFGAAQDAATAVGNQVKSSVEMATTSVVEIKNLDSLKEVVAQLTAAVVKLGGAAGGSSTVISAPANDDSAMIAKLDELIGLLKAGGIAVNLDGRKVSSGIARVSGT